MSLGFRYPQTGPSPSPIAFRWHAKSAGIGDGAVAPVNNEWLENVGASLGMCSSFLGLGKNRSRFSLVLLTGVICIAKH